MEKVERFFLAALKAAVMNNLVQFSEDLTSDDVISLYKLAAKHNVTPLVYESTKNLPIMDNMPGEYIAEKKKTIIKQVVGQAWKTSELKKLYAFLHDNGISLCVIKGIICRSLYTNPDARVSGDEDIFIPEDEYMKCHELMLKYGMELDDPEEDISAAYEVAYKLPGSPFYVEIHKHIVPPESKAYGELNKFFDGIHFRESGTHTGNCGLCEIAADGVTYLTFNHTDNLLYLILHSFKHFLNSGVGIRQICDIYLFAERYGNDIDWEYVYKSLKEVKADKFAASLFLIAEKYLSFDSAKACYPDYMKNIEVDEASMLYDMLEGGAFGYSEMSRVHSSNITIGAVEDDKKGKSIKTKQVNSVIKSVCLPVDSLKKKYKYLEKMPVLLPVAWTQRVFTYLKETKGNKKGNNAADALKIGAERTKLLKEYGIID